MKILLLAVLALYGLPLLTAETRMVVVWKSSPVSTTTESSSTATLPDCVEASTDGSTDASTDASTVSTVECTTKGIVPVAQAARVDVMEDVQICFGIVIGEKKVLTTASCVMGVTTLKVSHLYEIDSAKFYAATAISHEQFNSATKLNNLALLMLEMPEAAKFTASEISDIASTKPAKASICEHYFTTQGRMFETWNEHHTNVSIIDCPTQAAGFICSQSPTATEDLCDTEDEGGPLTCSGHVAGMYSVLNRCANKMAAYTDLAALKDWIDSDGKSASVKTSVTWLLVMTSLTALIAAVHL